MVWVLYTQIYTSTTDNQTSWHVLMVTLTEHVNISPTLRASCKQGCLIVLTSPGTQRFYECPCFSQDNRDLSHSIGAAASESHWPTFIISFQQQICHSSSHSQHSKTWSPFIISFHDCSMIISIILPFNIRAFTSRTCIIYYSEVLSFFCSCNIAFSPRTSSSSHRSFPWGRRATENMLQQIRLPLNPSATLGSPADWEIEFTFNLRHCARLCTFFPFFPWFYLVWISALCFLIHSDAFEWSLMNYLALKPQGCPVCTSVPSRFHPHWDLPCTLSQFYSSVHFLPPKPFLSFLHLTTLLSPPTQFNWKAQIQRPWNVKEKNRLFGKTADCRVRPAAGVHLRTA